MSRGQYKPQQAGATPAASPNWPLDVERPHALRYSSVFPPPGQLLVERSPSFLAPTTTPSSPISSSICQASWSRTSHSAFATSLISFDLSSPANFMGFGSFQLRMKYVPSAVPRNECAEPCEYWPMVAAGTFFLSSVSVSVSRELLVGVD